MLDFLVFGVRCLALFLWFTVSGFGVVASWLQKLTKFPFHVFINIDLISMIFKILFEGSSSFSDAHISQNR